MILSLLEIQYGADAVEPIPIGWSVLSAEFPNRIPGDMGTHLILCPEQIILD